MVAPIRRILPFSTCGRNASCCALLKRWISSMKTMVRVPYCLARSASAITCLISLMPVRTAENSTNSALVMRAMILRQRGLAGAGRSPEDKRADVVALDLHCAAACPDRAVVPGRRIHPACADACGRRAGAYGRLGCRCSGWFGKGSCKPDSPQRHRVTEKNEEILKELS